MNDIKKISNEIIDDFKKLAKDYNFKIRDNKNGISLCAKNTDKRWENWIIFNSNDNSIVLVGNTDQCNFWFCNTRPDLTPDKLTSFIADLNSILNKIDYEVKLRTLIDPEDWQEIARIQDAYEDPRYNENIKEKEKVTNEEIISNMLKAINNNEKILKVDDITSFINTNNREEWNYNILDLSEATLNNDYLAFNKEDFRIYELTKEEYETIDEYMKNNYFKYKDFYCRFINKNELSEEERKEKNQLDIYILKNNELKKVNTLYIEKNTSLEQVNKIIEQSMCQEIGKVLEDGIVEKEYFGQGYIYKNYENYYKREGICYIAECEEGRCDKLGVAYKDIQEEVYDYLKECGVQVEKVPEKMIEGMINDVFETVDWQLTSSLIYGDDYLEGYVEDFPKEYFFKNEKESEEQEV